MPPLRPALLLLYCAAAWAAGDPAEGRAVFRSNCAFCHGMTGGGGRGPSLARARGEADERLAAIVRNGIPGTSMPAFEGIDAAEMAHLIAYIRSLAGPGASDARVPGDAVRGRAVYQRNGCAACHRVGGEGSVFGPDLTRVGGARAAVYIRQSLMDPSADIPEEYQGVTVVTAAGERITGVRINEDTFTVQLRDPSQRFRMYRKSDLREVTAEKRSLMPPYGGLPPRDLQDLLSYLDGLRGPVVRGADVKKAEGIR